MILNSLVDCLAFWQHNPRFIQICSFLSLKPLKSVFNAQ